MHGKLRTVGGLGLGGASQAAQLCELKRAALPRRSDAAKDTTSDPEGGVFEELGPLVAQLDMATSSGRDIVFVGSIAPTFKEGGDPHQRGHGDRPHRNIRSFQVQQLVEFSPRVNQRAGWGDTRRSRLRMRRRTAHSQTSGAPSGASGRAASAARLRTCSPAILRTLRERPRIPQAVPR